MKRQVLFIGGGDNGGYEADQKLVDSLRQSLGTGYFVNYPELQTDDSAPDYGWLEQIGNIISRTGTDFILAAHSFGASMILKYLSENDSANQIRGIFLISTPFWSGNEDWKQGFLLQENFAEKLPKGVPVFLYHCTDDQEVAVEHLFLYAEQVPQATIRQIATGGHELNNDLSIVANDIKLYW